MQIEEIINKVVKEAMEDNVYEEDHVNDYLLDYFCPLQNTILKEIMTRIEKEREQEEYNEMINLLAEKDVDKILKNIKKNHHCVVYRKKDENFVKNESELWYIVNDSTYDNIFDYYEFYADSTLGVRLRWKYIKEHLIEALKKEDYQVEI